MAKWMFPRRSASGYEQFERTCGPGMLWLSVLFIPIYLFSLVPDLPADRQRMVDAISWVIWGVFVLEFAARLYLAPSRWQLIRNQPFDLLVIALPGLRAARALRGLRLAQGLVRPVIAIGGVTSLSHALGSARRVARRHGDRYVLFLVAVAALVGAITILNIEREAPESNIRTFGDAVWWAISTVMTVGYGDRFPTTGEGRVVAVILMVLGLGLFSVLTARVATFFLSDDGSNRELIERLDRLEGLLREGNDMPARGRGESMKYITSTEEFANVPVDVSEFSAVRPVERSDRNTPLKVGSKERMTALRALASHGQRDA